MTYIKGVLIITLKDLEEGLTDVPTDTGTYDIPEHFCLILE